MAKKKQTLPCPMDSKSMFPAPCNCGEHKPKVSPRNICKHCGAIEFWMQYTERAVAIVNSDGDVGEDGHNVQSYELDHSTATCRECDKPHDWTDADGETTKYGDDPEEGFTLMCPYCLSADVGEHENDCDRNQEEA